MTGLAADDSPRLMTFALTGHAPVQIDAVEAFLGFSEIMDQFPSSSTDDVGMFEGFAGWLTAHGFPPVSWRMSEGIVRAVTGRVQELKTEELRAAVVEVCSTLEGLERTARALGMIAPPADQPEFLKRLGPCLN